ncbi:MAG: ABC transporter substrate-binding protein [Alphaproteobacteria bacterium]|nr:ABC transporter substrate-binding protein [Alphaproteobacteria bacterium]
MKKNLFWGFLAVVLLGIGTARANVGGAKAEAFVKKVTTEGIEEIINANVSQQVKDQRFAKLFNEALDLDFIGQFVLGRNWRTSTPEQRSAFIKVYRELNVKTWSQRFDEFKGKNFIFSGTTPSNSKNQIFVNSSVPMEQGEPAKVVWRVKQSGNNYKIVDIIIENVSLAITARNEYSSFIKNNPGGVDALIKDLQKKVNQPVVKK